MLHQEIVLSRDCPATLIPAGDRVDLKAGSSVFVTQALGGSVTVRTASGLYRIEEDHLDALGDAVAFETSAGNPSAPPACAEFSEEAVWEALRQCYDPEIPINIVDLGLIYNLEIEYREPDLHFVQVKMTLTAQGCGMGPTIAEDARRRIASLPKVVGAKVDIVWDPVWTPQMISEAGRKKLGLN